MLHERASQYCCRHSAAYTVWVKTQNIPPSFSGNYFPNDRILWLIKASPHRQLTPQMNADNSRVVERRRNRCRAIDLSRLTQHRPNRNAKQEQLA